MMTELEKSLNVIVCVSDGGGMLFAKRRLSRDAVVISDVEKNVGDGVLFVSDYSAKLFEGSSLSAVCVENPLAAASAGDYVFLEAKGISDFKDKVESLTIYRWNRKYPFDTKLDFSPEKEGMRLSESRDIVGKSHEKITRELWVR